MFVKILVAVTFEKRLRELVDVGPQGGEEVLVEGLALRQLQQPEVGLGGPALRHAQVLHEQAGAVDYHQAHLRRQAAGRQHGVFRYRFEFWQSRGS